MQLFKPTISLSGGVGNQLFQWAAAHVLFKKTVFNLNLGHYQINPDREFELDLILESCIHCSGYVTNIGRTPLPKYFEWAAARGVPSNLLELLGFFQESSFDMKSQRKIQRRKSVGSPVIVEGLFQDVNIVEEAWPLIGNELTYALTQTLELVKTNLGLPNTYAAIHVRRGDYPITSNPSHAIGQLDDDFFIGIASVFDLPIILLTENASEVASLSKVLRARRIISSAEANPLQTLSILKNAELLVGSNSSLSWWGAYLAAKSGKRSYLPETWSQWGNYENSNLKHSLIDLSPSIWKLTSKGEQ